MPELGPLGAVAEFSAFETPLEKNVNLIEASAGTGKTFSIAMLVLRFVVEQKLSLEQILVVTFTKAATQELKTRIRRRLQDLRNYLINPDLSDDLDDAFRQWADQLDDQPAVITRLTEALSVIDNAAIFTIHGFCQRMLKQYALESGQLFDSELTANLDVLQLSLAEDYWRKQMYGASALKASLLSDSFATPHALAQSIKYISANMVIVPDRQDIDELIAQVETNSLKLASKIEKSLTDPLSVLVSEKQSYFTAGFLKSFDQVKKTIAAWVSSEGTDIPLSTLHGLSFTQLPIAAVNGTKIPKDASLTLEERKLAFLNDAGISELAGLDDLLSQVDQLSVALRLGLFDYIQSNLDAKKDALNVLAYDDLISRLAAAIEGPDNLLIPSLRRQFKVALIDEFQDTDQQQWDIFSGVFSTPEHFLYLIGDPKQAVYKFRGADIYSYLDAKKSAGFTYTLKKNYRSSAALLDAVNFLYSKRDAPFLIEGIPYYPVEAGKADKKDEQKNGLVLWYLDDNPQHKAGYWTSGAARTVIRGAVVNEIVRLLKHQSKSEEHSVHPQDIAILVRGNDEAANYQWALQQAKVPAVINSKNSVFDCEEAVYLRQLLTALERPADLQRMRQALVLPWFDLNGQAFDALCRDDLALQQYVMDFQDFNQRWQDFGLMAMMKSLLDHYQILQTISQTDSAERSITNLHHLLEIIQQVVLDKRLDTHKTLDWLTQAIQGEFRDEGTELRLEQDQEAVNIVTIHSAKGLEYPVVFAPELWYERPAKKVPARHEVVTCHKDGRLIADLGSADIAENFKQAQFEQQAEDLRLLYVAITRAANRCYLPWATVRTKDRDNSSAFAYLLEPHEGDDWQSKLSQLAKTVDRIEFAVIEVEQDSLQLDEPIDTSLKFEAKVAKRWIQQRWRMSSYSSLAYLSQGEHELPQDKSQEPIEPGAVVNEPTVELLPKGAHTGNVLHDILENSSFKQLSELSESTSAKTSESTQDDERYIVLRSKSCIRYGLELEPEAEIALDELLVRSVQAPLDTDDNDFYLANIPDNDCLKEMAFYFSVNELQTAAINQLLVDKQSYQPLSARQLSGQLTGFIDLICQYQGRYYVMDYKSNSLPEYDSKSLQYAMQQHNYGLQYYIYSLVLHRYLKQRLPDYSYDQHFGGVRYLFLRGMDKAQPMQGVFVDKPSLKLIENLGEIFSKGDI